MPCYCEAYSVTYKSYPSYCKTENPKTMHSRTPEIETADLSQSHVSICLKFGLIVYFIETQVQQPKIIETCV